MAKLPSIAFAEVSSASLATPHDVTVDERSGAAVVRIPIPAPAGRRGFGPALALEYRSRGGNSPFGMGWALAGLPSVSLDSSRGVPRYDGRDPVHFSLAGEMVPARVHDGTTWTPDADIRDGVIVRQWRARHESGFLRLEQWTDTATGRVHWRSRDAANTVTLYGHRPDGLSRLTDPDDPTRVLSWLPDAQIDAYGNAITFDYLAENDAGVDRSRPSERHRHLDAPPQRYLKTIRWGNTVPASVERVDAPGNRWSFALVLDYGDHRTTPSPVADQAWPCRRDPFSNTRGGFDLRTWRLCQRVLTFHDFDALGPSPLLTSELVLTHDANALGTTLQQVHVAAHRTAPGTGARTTRTLPPITFTYATGGVDDAFVPAPDETLENTPAGLATGEVRWIDLYGEGLPGLLTETNTAWFYKANEGDGYFGPLQLVTEKPSPTRPALTDFDADGRLDAAVLHGRQPGYFRRELDGGRWQPFQPIGALPHVEAARHHARWLDLTGNGRSDLVVSDSSGVTWYASDKADAFEPGVTVARTDASAPVVEDPALGYFFADMNGDGLVDQVRVRNGAIEYWPQLGHGRFAAAPVVMDDAPVFADDGSFDPRRLRFVDLGGTGASDLCYLGPDAITFWRNAQGNGWVEHARRAAIGTVDSQSSVAVLDFLGTGQPCLVWSTPLATAATGLQYLTLSEAVAPGLLVRMDNGLGKQIDIAYSSSSRHYLRDRRAGRAWRAGVSRHVMVVDAVTTTDLVGGAAGELRYEYHDGYYDSHERQFVGFGLVDRFEGDLAPTATSTAPTGAACHRTWFHPGSAIGLRGRLTDAYALDPDEPLLTTLDVEAPGEWIEEELADAVSAAAGRVVRTERYAVEAGGQRAIHPLETVQHRFALRRLQPAGDPWGVSVLVHQVETLAAAYEGEAGDPRTVHEFALATDAFGLPTLEASVAYRRRPGHPTAVPSQAEEHLTVERRTFVHRSGIDRLQLGVLLQTETFEVRGLPTHAGTYERRQLGTLVEAALAAPLTHEASWPAGPAARRLTWEQHTYWNDAIDGPAPSGDVGALAIPHHSELAAFSVPFVGAAWAGRVDGTMLQELGYLERDGHWWQVEPTFHVLPAAEFFLPVRVERPAGGTAAVVYDPSHLFPIESTDPAGNRLTAEIDYQALAPSVIVDANLTRSEVRYDPCGVITVSSVTGTVLDAGGTERPIGHVSLASHVAPATADTADVLANPGAFIQQAALFRAYDLDGWRSRGEPAHEVVVMRERYVHDGTGTPPGTSPFKLQVTYLDGFSREKQVKVLAEPGPAVARNADGTLRLDADGQPINETAPERWMVSGGVVYDRAQRAIRSYEPFYSATSRFENEPVLASIGVSRRTSYDAAGRVVREDFPNGTYTRTVLRAWEVTRHDANDTVMDAAWRTQRAGLAADDPERLALQEAESHADTPTRIHLDPLGRDLQQVDVDPGGTHRITTGTVNAHGRTTQIVDPRGLAAVDIVYDMLDRTAALRSVDGGPRWTISDVHDRTRHVWDARGIHQATAYDDLDRVTTVHVDEGGGGPRLAEQRIYGDDPTVADGAARNARGRLVLHRDQAGLLEVDAYDLSGQASRSSRQLCTDYRSEADWTSPAAVALDPERHVSSTTFDALGRPIEQQFPDGSRRRYTHATGGGLERLTLDTSDGLVTGLTVFEEAAYNARGERTSIRLGNGVRLEQEYDPETYLTQRIAAFRQTTAGSDTIQDLRYTCDPTGNVVAVRDMVQEPGGGSSFLTGALVSATALFAYDHFGRLARAEGRVHQALLEHDYQPGVAGADARKGTRHLTFNNGAALERYTRTYRYDLAGNLLQMAHAGQTRSWTTAFWVSPTSNRSLPATDPNGTVVAAPESRFDANGNTIHLPHLRQLTWTTRNSIASAVVIERPGGPDDAEYYVYDSNNVRVRKVSERLVGGQLEVTDVVTLDGCEIRRVRLGTTLQLERLTSHLGDGAARVALVHRWTTDVTARDTSDITRARVRYQLPSHVGSALLELDELGQVVTYEEYFPFGGTAFVAGDDLREVDRRSYRFCGKERDDATGLYYVEHRYYAAWLGRWMSPDPAGPDGSVNLYAYVGNDPVNSVDPQGLNGRRRAAVAIRVQHIPWESLPASYQATGARDRVHYVLYGPSADGPATFQNFTSMADMEAAARRTPGSWIGVYDPRWQRHYEAAREAGRTEDVARERAEVMLQVEDLTSWMSRELAAVTTDPAESSNGSGEWGMTIGGDRSAGGGSGSDGAGSGEGGTDGTGGGATGAGGGPAAGNGTTGSGDAEATGTHAADGSSTATTPPAGSGGGTGTGDQPGSGPGAGASGSGRGGGGTRTGPAGGGNTGSGTGRGRGRSGTGTGATGTGGGTTDTGAGSRPGGSSGGSADGSTDGVPGGTGTVPGGSGTTPGGSGGSGHNGTGGQATGGDPNGDPGGSATGSPGGSPTGADGGAATGGTGTTASGSGNTSGTPTGSSTGTGTSPGTGESQPGGGSGSGRSGPPETTMDRLTRYAGYLNLEFGDGSPDGESGGVPGGMGSLNLGSWGQALYIGLSIAGVVLTVLSLGTGLGLRAALRAGMAGLRTALTAVARTFTREGLKRIGARIAAWWGTHSIEVAVGRGAIRLFPVHAAWRAGTTWLHAAGSKPLYALQQFVRTFRGARAGGAGFREAMSAAWTRYGGRLTQLQRVSAEGAADFAEDAVRFRLPALFPQLAPATEGRAVLSCVTSTWNAWSRTNLHIPNLVVGGGAGYGIYRLFFGGSGDAPASQEGTTNAGAR